VRHLFLEAVDLCDQFVAGDDDRHLGQLRAHWAVVLDRHLDEEAEAFRDGYFLCHGCSLGLYQ
jgi:hypothetical protein